MPKELEPYRKLIESGCGGNTAEDLLNRKGVNYFNNPIVCELIGMCQSKVNMIEKLIELNLLEKLGAEEIKERIEKQ